MNILLTGQSGFLGGQLYNVLRINHNVINLSFRTENDINSFFSNFDQKIDVLIHCGHGGASSSQNLNDIEQIYNINTSISLFLNCIKYGLKKVIYFGSSWQFNECDDNLYKFAKNEIDRILRELCKINNIQYNLIVPFFVYGPGDRKNRFIPQIIQKCLKNEEINLHPAQNLVDYLYIDDFVLAVDLILNKGENFITYNVCSGCGYKIQDTVEKIKLLTNSNSKITYNKEYPPNFNMKWISDNSTLKKLGWVAKVGLEEGLDKTIKKLNN